jgi:hypothetical protein
VRIKEFARSGLGLRNWRQIPRNRESVAKSHFNQSRFSSALLSRQVDKRRQAARRTGRSDSCETSPARRSGADSRRRLSIRKPGRQSPLPYRMRIAESVWVEEHRRCGLGLRNGRQVQRNCECVAKRPLQPLWRACRTFKRFSRSLQTGWPFRIDRHIYTFETKNGPIARKSISVPRKHFMASSGVQTMGSPRTLNDVLIRTGTSENSAKLLIKR